MRLWDAAGYLAAGLVITAFCMKGMVPLRIVALTSNVAFLVYGIGLGLVPVWLLHAILLPVNSWRLWQRIARRPTAAAPEAVPGAAHAEGDMCQERTAAAAAIKLMNTLSWKVVRVLVTLKEKGQDRATIDRDTSNVAEALRRAGAYVADPISGQPLVVAEIDGDRLSLVAQHPQVACIAADVPERTQ